VFDVTTAIARRATVVVSCHGRVGPAAEAAQRMLLQESLGVGRLSRYI
jgi:hypothetical protein